MRELTGNKKRSLPPLIGERHFGTNKYSIGFYSDTTYASEDSKKRSKKQAEKQAKKKLPVKCPNDE